MADYLLLMHDDGGEEAAWDTYIGRLQGLGVFRGGSAIGGGVCERKSGTAPAISTHLIGFIRIEATDLQHARSVLSGNPVFEAGGTVEIRALPATD